MWGKAEPKERKEDPLSPEVTTALIASPAAILTSLAVLVAAWRAGRNVNGKLDEIHVLVNSRLTEALDKIEAFEKRLGLPPGADPNSKEEHGGNAV